MTNNHASTHDQDLSTMRHSCAHIMASAIQQLWPDAQFGVGPTIDNGFYYDVLLPETLSEEDLEKIESRMRKLKKKKSRFDAKTLPIDELIELMKSQNQPFKVDLLNLLKTKGSTAIKKATGDDNAVDHDADTDLKTATLYQVGTFQDLCRGPHVEHSGQIGHFKLHKLSGAYWRGDDKNPQLQRIYGLCFATQEEVDREIERLEQLKERDHRKLAKALDIYHISDQVGRGLPMWLPNGMAIRCELQALAQAHERLAGYQEVATPHLAKEKLYLQSGHLPYYKDDMYKPIEIDEEVYYLKPMNCPHHHQLYKAHMHSYRDLPVRFSEWGQVYRYEKSGALSGLMRARGFCMNDAHIYCRIDQTEEEIKQVLLMHLDYYRIFNITEYSMVLCLPDFEQSEKYSEDKEKWLYTANIIRNVMKSMGLPFVEEEGEAAFYGPKIDFIIHSALGTAYTISTCQLDFLAPERFDLQYRAESGENEPVLVIHRAPLGTHERFIAFLLEHFAGHFPLWLAPVQICIIPIADRHIDYAKSVYDRLFRAPIQTATSGLRLSIDISSERMQKKIRQAQLKKIPYMVIVGDEEVSEQSLSVRNIHGQTERMGVDAFVEKVKQEIVTKALKEDDR